MTRRRLMGIYLLAGLLVAFSQTAPSQVKTQPTSPQRDGQHDFDFNFGVWKSHIKRLRHPLANSNEWIEVNGTLLVSKVWNGRANLEEIEADGPAGHLEGLTLRLYNPESRQWYLSWANSNDGTLGKAMAGEFKNGQGVFYDQETFKGRAILVRQIYSDVTPNSYHFDQSFSDDGGKTWESNWVATVTRESEGKRTLQQTASDENRQHDFDFNLGSWKTQVSRLKNPLTGSTNWIEYEGTSLVRRSKLDQYLHPDQRLRVSKQVVVLGGNTVSTFVIRHCCEGRFASRDRRDRYWRLANVFRLEPGIGAQKKNRMTHGGIWE